LYRLTSLVILSRSCVPSFRLGKHRIGVFVGDGDKHRIRHFVSWDRRSIRRLKFIAGVSHTGREQGTSSATDRIRKGSLLPVILESTDVDANKLNTVKNGDVSCQAIQRSSIPTRKYCSDSIKTCVPPIGLIICDEGHRLKSKDNKTTKMFDSLSTKRRISMYLTCLSFVS
jgi:hypothetical protein